MIVHRDLKPANLMLGGIPHETGTREMVHEPTSRTTGIGCFAFASVLADESRQCHATTKRIVCTTLHLSETLMQRGICNVKIAGVTQICGSVCMRSEACSGGAGGQREDRGLWAQPVAGDHAGGQQARQHDGPELARQAGA